ncbi:MAG: hypothetical protein INR70_15970 [Parafilimonas terrae]|nr:hypothetical protein [Parafilimonas terrae]
MTDPLSYTLALDISVQDPDRVLEAASLEMVGRRSPPRSTRLWASSPETWRRRSWC